MIPFYHNGFRKSSPAPKKAEGDGEGCPAAKRKTASRGGEAVADGSTEPSGDIRSGALVLRVVEDHVGRVVFRDLAEQKERGLVGDARRLLHTVRDHDDGIVLFQFDGKLLDAGGLDRIER